MNTVAERLRWAMDQLPEYRGRGGQMRLAGASGISAGLISQILNGRRKRPTSQTLLALSSALEIDYAWLSHGVGVWRDESTYLLNLPQNFVVAMQFARLSGDYEEAVQAIINDVSYRGAEEFTPLDWWEEIRLKKRDLQRGKKGLCRSATELDDPPSGAK